MNGVGVGKRDADAMGDAFLLMQWLLVCRKQPVQPEHGIAVVGAGVVVLEASVLRELIDGELLCSICQVATRVL